MSGWRWCRWLQQHHIGRMGNESFTGTSMFTLTQSEPYCTWLQPLLSFGCIKPGKVVHCICPNFLCWQQLLTAHASPCRPTKHQPAPCSLKRYPSATYGEVVRQQAARASEAAAGGQQQQQLPPHKPKQGDQGRPGQLQQQPESAAALAAERWQAYALPDELQPGSAGQPVAVRCVGCGYGKQKRLLQLWVREQRGIPGVCVPEVMPEVPFITADCEVGKAGVDAGGSWGGGECWSGDAVIPIALLSLQGGSPNLI